MRNNREGFEVPFLEFEQIRQKADEFLLAYHDGGIPIPIEDIVDRSLLIDIVPTSRLIEEYSIDGYLCKNKKEIKVDSGVSDGSPARYRFTLAHELGHLLLHAEVYDKVNLRSREDWIHFVTSIPERTRNRYEWQAYTFAGLVLVPSRELVQIAKGLITSAHEKGIVIDVDSPNYERFIKTTASKFEVSSAVIKKRLEKDAELRKHMKQIIRSPSKQKIS